MAHLIDKDQSLLRLTRMGKQPGSYHRYESLQRHFAIPTKITNVFKHLTCCSISRNSSNKYNDVSVCTLACKNYTCVSKYKRLRTNLRVQWYKLLTQIMTYPNTGFFFLKKDMLTDFKRKKETAKIFFMVILVLVLWKGYVLGYVMYRLSPEIYTRNY